MPASEQWESYFDAAGILDALGCERVSGDAIEFGCGYGTFTIPCAQRVSGIVYALDIDPLMVAATAVRASQRGVKNVFVERRDFVSEGCGRGSESANLVLLFNILHIEDPISLLKEAHRVLCVGGRVVAIHWKYDPQTPRGPPLDIRPRPEQCRAWGEEAGFKWVLQAGLPGTPWHWGMVLSKR
jgi:SAM-dependent methyltransferase